MINLLSLFSGIGAFEQALTNIGVPFNLVGYCEVDKYASRSYAAIHNTPESKNLGDITKHREWDITEPINLITYGFPCQDISTAGKQKGFVDDNGQLTRSGLFFEALDIIEKYQPDIAIAENVKALTSKKFAKEFQLVLDSLEEAGYNNYWQVLNAKDFGVPQHRERVFIVSIRKDIDKGSFVFPQGFPLQKCLRDVLEEKVDSKFYLKDEKVVPFINKHIDKIEALRTEPDGTAHTIKATYYKTPQANFTRKSDQGATGVIINIGNIHPCDHGMSGLVLTNEKAN